MCKRRKRGFALVEFTVVTIPLIFITTSIIEMSLESWKFESMSFAIQAAARYACAHGRTCTKSGNTCTIRVQDVVSVITSQAPSLNTSLLNVSLVTSSATKTCNPISSCATDTTQFPNTTDNGVGSDIKITATYPMNNPLPFFWFGSGSQVGPNFTLGATTRQTIVY
jgi:Flp pilus assembly protein TadG